MTAEDLTDVASPERFDAATDRGKLIHSEHLARYAWASQLTAGLDVLDAGCGTGYGTAILAASAPRSLRAYDVDEHAVEQTRAALGSGAEVAVGDVSDLPLPDDAVDVVVCFEVIEHLERREDALREFARVLRPDGVLAISSPNRNQYPPGNEHHVHEYTPSELEAELGRHFGRTRLYGQRAMLASVIASDDQLAATADAALHSSQDPLPEELFTLALAGDGPLPSPAAHVAAGETFELRWWHDQVSDLQHAAHVAERELARRDDRLEALGAKLLDAEQARGEAVALQGELDALKRELATAQYRIDRADRVMADVTRSFSWRVTAPLRCAKGRLRRP